MKARNTLPLSHKHTHTEGGTEKKQRRKEERSDWKSHCTQRKQER